MKFAVVSIYDDIRAADRIPSGFNCIALSLLQAGHEVDYHTTQSIRDVVFDYDVYIISVNTDVIQSTLVDTIAGHHGKIIAFTDGVSQRFECLGLATAAKTQKIFDCADVIITNSDANYHYFQVWYGDKAKLIGLPVNIDFIVKEFCASEVEPEDDLVWQGYISENRPHHNILYQIKVAECFGLKSLLVVESRDTNYANRIEEALYNMGFSSVEVCRGAAPDGFLGGYLKRCSYAMYFPQRPSLGRTPAECAVACIPCLGTKNYFQAELFPTITFDELCDDIGYRMIDLIRDKTFRDEILAYARKRVELYQPDTWYRKFEEVLGELW